MYVPTIQANWYLRIYYMHRLEHQLEHLEKSQAYLMEALAESPEDSDFKEAFVENCGAIERRRGSIRESKLLLQMVDPVYFAEHYRSQLQEQQVQPVQLPQQVDMIMKFF